MPRDNIPITQMRAGEAVNRGAGEIISVANGAEIQCNGDTRGLYIEVTNTNGSDRVMTIREGDGPLACYGDMALTIPATSGDKLICLEGARFVQMRQWDENGNYIGGKILIDFAASFAGIIRAFRLPKP